MKTGHRKADSPSLAQQRRTAISSQWSNDERERRARRARQRQIMLWQAIKIRPEEVAL